MEKVICQHCNEEFTPERMDYKVTIDSRGRVEVTLKCDSCDEDIEYTVVDQKQFIRVGE